MHVLVLPERHVATFREIAAFPLHCVPGCGSPQREGRLGNERRAVKHEAYAVWFRPDGREQDRANYAVEGADARFWFWLRLSPSFGGKLLKPIDPSYGMGEFIGPWRVDLYLDDKAVATKVFSVVC